MKDGEGLLRSKRSNEIIGNRHDELIPCMIMSRVNLRKKVLC